MVEYIIDILTLGIPAATALLLASTGEMFNQRSGIFNLGCEGIMSMGAFIGFLVPTVLIGYGFPELSSHWLGVLAAPVIGALFGLLFGVVVIVFKAPQGIAGIGFQMFGVGVAGSLFRHFVGGVATLGGIGNTPIPGLSQIPIIGNIFFNHNLLVYFAFLFVPVSWFILMKSSWGLKVRACGAAPRAADSVGVEVNRTRFQALAIGGALAGLAGCYLSIFQAKMFDSGLIAGRGFIAVALVYFGRWSPWRILGGSLLFSLANSLQFKLQIDGSSFPYEFAVMLPYLLVIITLAFTSKNNRLGPRALGVPFDRENRLRG